MSHYFFDLEGGKTQHDIEGMELPDASAVENAALRTLMTVAQTQVGGGHFDPLTVVVRDARGTSLYRATLAVGARWIEAEQAGRARSAEAATGSA